MKKKIVIATTLGLLLTANGVYAGTKIADVGTSQFKAAIYNVVDKGYMEFVDKDSNFAPNQQVNRAQLAQILTNFENKLAEQEAQKELQSVKAEVKGVTQEQQEDSSELTVIGNTMKSVVKIKDGSASGSGVFLDENTILTAYHVVDNGNTTVEVRLSDYHNTIKGTVQAIDDWQDLAIIKIDDTLNNNNYKVRPIELANAEVKLGETIYAFGNPKGVDFAVTKGIISNTSQAIAMKSMYQFDAAIHPGNSGGPLVNSKGQLVGVVNSILTDEKKLPYHGVGFATKLTALQGFLKQHE